MGTRLLFGSFAFKYLLCSRVLENVRNLSRLLEVCRDRCKRNTIKWEYFGSIQEEVQTSGTVFRKWIDEVYDSQTWGLINFFCGSTVSRPNPLLASFQSKRYFNITNSRNNLKINKSSLNFTNSASWKTYYIVSYILKPNWELWSYSLGISGV